MNKMTIYAASRRRKSTPSFLSIDPLWKVNAHMSIVSAAISTAQVSMIEIPLNDKIIEQKETERMDVLLVQEVLLKEHIRITVLYQEILQVV